MGVFENIFGKKNKQQSVSPSGYFKLLNAYTPIFSSWGGMLYENELVRASIDARSRHISKLGMNIYGTAHPRLQTNLRHRPNDMQTWPQFLYRLNTILDMQNTAFIVPIWDDYLQEKTGIVTFLPSGYELIDVDGEAWIRFKFSNNSPAVAKLSDVGILTKFQYSNDYFGEDNHALDSTMDLIHIQRQGITEAVKSTASFRFMATAGNFAKESELKAERQRFTEANLNVGNAGVLLFPNTYKDVKQITSTPYTVNSAEMQMIQTNVYTYFGVNEKVLQNTANGDDLDSFFNGAIEPFAIQLSDTLTNMIFTQLEQSNGCKIVSSANRLQYMTVSEKVSMTQQLADRGALMIDEIRDLFNLPPLPDGKGQGAPIRGEYVMVGNSDRTDLNKSSDGEGKEGNNGPGMDGESEKGDDDASKKE